MYDYGPYGRTSKYAVIGKTRRNLIVQHSSTRRISLSLVLYDDCLRWALKGISRCQNERLCSGVDVYAFHRQIETCGAMLHLFLDNGLLGFRVIQIGFYHLLQFWACNMVFCPVRSQAMVVMDKDLLGRLYPGKKFR